MCRSCVEINDVKMLISVDKLVNIIIPITMAKVIKTDNNVVRLIILKHINARRLTVIGNKYVKD